MRRERISRTSAVEIGKLVFAWSDLHMALCHIFSILVDRTMMGVGHEIWHSTLSDRTQRGMLAAAIRKSHQPTSRKMRPHVTDELITSVEWLLKETDGVANLRNTIVHSAYVIILREDKQLRFMLNPLSGPKALASYDKVILPYDINHVRRKVEVLAKYANAVHWAFMTPQPSWPKKPALPTRGQRTRTSSTRRRSSS